MQKKLMKKKTVNIIVCLLTSFLVSACASNAQTVEVTRIVQQTVEVTRIVQQTFVIIQYATSIAKPYPPNMTPTPIWTPTFTETPFIKSTQRSPTLTDQQVSDKIAACDPTLNNSVQHVRETTRIFISVPKDLYPKELFRYATTINGQATMGWISNGGLPGLAFARSPGCWSTYVEFDGGGEIDLRIPSIIIGVPDYYVRFIVDLLETPGG